jgi:hypothetical protein
MVLLYLLVSKFYLSDLQLLCLANFVLLLFAFAFVHCKIEEICIVCQGKRASFMCSFEVGLLGVRWFCNLRKSLLRRESNQVTLTATLAFTHMGINFSSQTFLTL